MFEAIDNSNVNDDMYSMFGAGSYGAFWGHVRQSETGSESLISCCYDP